MKTIKIMLEKGVIAAHWRQKLTVKSLGLSHRHQVKVVKDLPAVRGMIRKVSHLVKIVENEKVVPNKVLSKTDYQLI